MTATTAHLPCPVAPLVPHARGMCLLTRLLEADAEGAIAEGETRPDDLFAEAAGLPAWVGIEWIAQSVAAWAGYHAQRRGESPTPGLLLGSRRYRAVQPHWPFGRRIHVAISIDFVADNGVTQVNGELRWADGSASLASGSLTLYRPAGLDLPGQPPAT